MVCAPDWVAECRTYKDGLDQTVVGGLATILSKNLAMHTGSVEINHLIEKAQAAEDPSEKAHLEAAIVSAARAVSELRKLRKRPASTEFPASLSR